MYIEHYVTIFTAWTSPLSKLKHSYTLPNCPSPDK